MDRNRRFAIAIISLLATANFSTQESTSGREKPRINFYGTFTDRQGATYDVENITINGMYKYIQLYEIPTSASMKPQDDMAKLDLIDIANIQLPSTESSIKRYPENSGPEFIEISITQNDEKNTSHTYLIEANRKLWFDKKDGSDIDKEVSFKALGKLVIQGCKQQQEEKSVKKCGQAPATEAKKEEISATK